MTRYIGVVGSKGGIGKTTVTLNLANSLNKLKKSTLAVDGDFNSPDFESYFNEHFEKPMNSVWNGNSENNEIINRTEAGLYYITMSHKLSDLHSPNIEKFENTIHEYKNQFEYVLIDTPSNLSRDKIFGMNNCNELILVTEPNLLSVKEALRTKRVGEQFGKNFIGLIINKVSGSKFELSKNEIRQILELPLLGAIDHEKSIIDCMHNHILSTDYSIFTNSSREFVKIAKKLIR